MTAPTESEPQAIIADAEQEAREAAELVATLEEKVRDGDEAVTFEEVEKARGLLSFVRLRQEAARRKAAKAQEAARLAACEALHAEIQDHAKSEGAELAKQLKGIVDAMRAFSDAVEARNNRVQEYRTRAVELGIPEHTNPTPPPAAHGRVGLTANGGGYGVVGVLAGRRRVEEINRDVFLNGALSILSREGKFKYVDSVDGSPEIFDRLADIDAEAPESSAKHFYRNLETGAVFRKDVPFTDDEIRRGNLTVITKAEAEGE